MTGTRSLLTQPSVTSSEIDIPIEEKKTFVQENEYSHIFRLDSQRPKITSREGSARNQGELDYNGLKP